MDSSDMGRIGGKRGMANRTPRERHLLAKKAAKARWARYEERKRLRTEATVARRNRAGSGAGGERRLNGSTRRHHPPSWQEGFEAGFRAGFLVGAERNNSTETSGFFSVTRKSVERIWL